MTTTSQQIALVTGANKGLGRETARRLAAVGMTVLATARDAGRGQPLPSLPSTTRTYGSCSWT